MTIEFMKCSAFFTTNGSKFFKIISFYVRLFSTTFSCLALNIVVLEPLQPSIGNSFVKMVNYDIFKAIIFHKLKVYSLYFKL